MVVQGFAQSIFSAVSESLVEVAKNKNKNPQSYEPLLINDEELNVETEAVEVTLTPPFMPSGGLLADFKAHVRSMKEYGSVLFGLEVLRTLCLCALLGLSIYATILAESPEEHQTVLEDGTIGDMAKHWGKKKHKKKKGKHSKSTVDDYSSLEWGEFGVSGFYVYTLVFSLLLLTLRPATRLRRHIITHLDSLLLLAFAVYAYRDIWPLFTFNLAPEDINTPVTWARVVLLTVSAVLIPLVRPRTYVPVDPEHPSPPGEIHPEQTSPLLFYLFFEYMTGLVWKAWKTPALPYEDLHPLADYDRAEYLYKQHMDKLDPVRRKEKGLKPRNLVLSLASVFKKEIVMVCLMSAMSAIFELSGSVGINQLLDYLEKDGKGHSLRPIVWIIFLFLGPTFGSLTMQFYIFTTTRSLVRSEALLTQLLFDHALRLRMKDQMDDNQEKEVDDMANGEGSAPLITVQNVEEVIGHAPGAPEEFRDRSDNETEEESIAHGSGKRKSTPQSTDATEVGSVSDSNKDAAVDRKAAADEEARKSKGQGLAGKINVLMAADIESVIEGRDLALIFVYTPVQFVLCVVLLYRILSWSSLIGMLTMFITLPLPGLLTKLNAQFQQKRMIATDSRIDTITESINALRIIKMFGWEERIKERVAAKREEELTLIWQRRLMNLFTTLLNTVLPVLTMTVTFAVYTTVQKQQLTAAKVFTSMTVFELVKGQLGMCFYLINSVVTAWVSVRRLDKFLHESEMIDEYSEGKLATIKPSEQLEAEQEGLIRIHDATFTWGSQPDATGEVPFKLKIEDTAFKKGKINLITGPTGSGKSSLLKALIGELHFEQKQGAFYHLPRENGVSYAAQESWCTSDSVRDNILFGEPFEESRYWKVVSACGLEPDLKLFDDGDLTEVGEKGITLSGGQKARLTLARAIYSKTAIVLLDDIFSALDTLTSRWIIDNLLNGDLVKDRTILLITHHIHLAAPVADFIITLNEDGSVRSQGSINEGALDESELQEAEEVEEQEIKEAKQGEKKVEEKPTTKLTQAEEKGEGRISRKALFAFFRTFGGPIFWFLYFGLLVGGQAMSSFETYWLGRWARAYDQAEDPTKVSVTFYLGLYFVFVLIGLVQLAASAILFYMGAVKASREIHKRLVDTIFGAYLRFLDSTPVGRIISRFTKDMKSVDGSFTETFANVADVTVGLALKIIVVISLVPLFSLPAIFIGCLGGILGEMYIHGQLSVKREMSNAKSPLFSHFSAAFNGIVSIRAYGAQQKFRVEAQRRADKYTRAATAFYNLNRWVTIRLDMLGGLFAASLAAFLVYGPRLDASTSGFALSQAISFSSMILWWVRMVNEMEVQGNSVERIQDYLVIPQEPAFEESKQPPAAWPTSGEIVLDHLCAKYSNDGPTVLDDLELTIKSGEKVGIVGRTGSGKSTLALALLRMLPTTGKVLIDGVDTGKINLHALRSNVTIIPQDPILLSGSLRFNLDPFGEHDDYELNDALQQSGLGATRQPSDVGTTTPQRLTLDTQISAGGGNLSQGQRQLVALARALVRNSKVLILDEATASVDFDTDILIQKSIRDLPSSCTVLTVAHRLSTIMDYDRVLVLGAGKVLEFDAPETLKKNSDSYFGKLCQAMEGNNSDEH
ncbi:ATP-binding cassette (ABC) transporter, putative [Cryptococcus gattii WM276]|uniref:ATP-binding cassette (ABC) transporter, putative n=1 Tax=Cryptococcus gattii serotype B (strain WM276 / ATCC MYA-4071) TaxID=367775 RepID=E6R2U2_CRYGW|nr:ATP-binding cassette (ABC) transporter, putative [Cryptococcus gattii WM276]ADV20810.1 ATP-binding cassette (ABC) transporter, putative [Cryptococcus gattii WM276]